MLIRTSKILSTYLEYAVEIWYQIMLNIKLIAKSTKTND